jgi:class 3 adenylate cyclase
MAVSIENARAYGNLVALNTAYERFVPSQFLGYLGREEITDVRLGDQVAADMSVLFLDVRDFSRFAGGLSPAEVFAFINNLLGRIEPILDKWGGFVDKYIGDGLMALFPDSADDAVACAVEIFQDLKRYNEEKRSAGGKTIDMGIGIDSGELMLGTIGSTRRMDSTVISSVVNRAARMEELNKTYSTHILIGSATRDRLSDAASHCLRTLGETVTRGVKVNIYEVYDADPPDSIERKNRSRKTLEEAAAARQAGDLDGAIGRLRYAVRRDPDDLPLGACLREIEVHLDAPTQNERSSAPVLRSQGAWSDRLGHSPESQKHKKL